MCSRGHNRALGVSVRNVHTIQCIVTVIVRLLYLVTTCCTYTPVLMSQSNHCATTSTPVVSVDYRHKVIYVAKQVRGRGGRGQHLGMEDVWQGVPQALYVDTVVTYTPFHPPPYPNS